MKLKTAQLIVEEIISNLDNRKGFQFYEIDDDILDEIKDELAEIVLLNANNE